MMTAKLAVEKAARAEQSLAPTSPRCAHSKRPRGVRGLAHMSVHCVHVKIGRISRGFLMNVGRIETTLITLDQNEPAKMNPHESVESRLGRQWKEQRLEEEPKLNQGHEPHLAIIRKPNLRWGLCQKYSPH